ncbi:MAG: hypothetical protein A2556_00380 [Candidatus Vogelbacteria bacterium RIFOXYD2_FULL_44_9]|uniref:UDP-N-acetylmuramate--L-alanine ligase n=1 Tax=Candidatus Vogelbacteria bacterium RIFOXYD2_FULL_44_9 TaxID=1802441 RepID=A0A1G2QQK2_9BACT|nr:MAG: hypothetical protein A2556_00380 [Candidatus Vogelbacteria bacterium RIFOXYD2_FULL_44_9]
MSNLANLKKVHFIGIGGIGMSAVARMFLLENNSPAGRVTGSDRSRSIVTEELQKLGAKIFYDQKADNISADTDLVVYTIAIPEDNPELKKARELRIKCLTYPEMLGFISADKYTIAISGTHGKTTTTAMLAQVLIEAKLDPTVIVGSLLRPQGDPGEKATNSIRTDASRATSNGVNFIAGKSDYFVVEACEYRRSFLNLNPKILVITNIDSDHLDYYKDLADIQSAFIEMVAKIPTDGFLVCDLTDLKVAPVVTTAKCQVIDYRQAKELKELLVPGEHNIRDAQAVLAVSEILKIDQAVAEGALNKFSGTWRRFEFKGQTSKGALVYDDYAHHPTEISATIAGARDLMSQPAGGKNLTGRLIIAFQPHLYSRTKSLFGDFAIALAGADRVLLAKIYAAREAFDSSVSESELINEINNRAGKNIATFVGDLVSVEKDLSTEAVAGDLVITMGAGDISLVSDKLVG